MTMRKISSKEAFLPSTGGDVGIHSFCRPEDIRRYTLHPEFKIYDNYRSLYTDREDIEKDAGQPEANVVLALSGDERIIGFGVLSNPDSQERWADLSPGLMMELKAIEVCRSWRTARVASAILEMMLSFPGVEEKIIYLVGYSWTWDLQGTGKTIEQYRRMLIRLFESQGFKQYRTNEPNVCLRPENFFMCRIGNGISPAVRDRFKWLRFGILH